MSDDYVHLIPEEPGFVPKPAKHKHALAYFHSITPRPSEITLSVSETIEFIHCGGNFGKIFCPSCGAVIELRQWQGLMDEDFQGRGRGFALPKHTLPCCGAKSTLHELNYEWPQGFARFDLYAMNPNIGKLSEKQVTQFEQLLGCRLRIVYEHR